MSAPRESQMPYADDIEMSPPDHSCQSPPDCTKSPPPDDSQKPPSEGVGDARADDPTPMDRPDSVDG
jgi:hypothetical protein